MLAGGGLAGIAWETGILCGIADEIPEAARALLAADVLLGTSAGSTVAAQLGSGTGLDELFARQVAEESHEIDSGVDVDEITELFVTAMMTPGITKEQKLQRIGAIALSADTVAESVRRDVISHRLPSHDWPARVLRVTAIDAVSGELVVLDAGAGVDLVDAVAASCAVPGAWPPVTIGDRRFIDGGVGSIVNMPAAADCGAVVVLVPSGENSPSPFGSGAGCRDRRVSRRDPGRVRRRRRARRVRPQPTRPGMPDPVRPRRTRTGPSRSRSRRPFPRCVSRARRLGAAIRDAGAAPSASSATAASSWPMSMTSSARWNSRLRPTTTE